jgi:hypothetical protein
MVDFFNFRGAKLKNKKDKNQTLPSYLNFAAKVNY